MVSPRRSTEKHGGVAACPPSGGHLETPIIQVGLYLRVSTQLQVEGDSLEEQENELRKFCTYRNFQIYKLYIEEGKSGGNTKRPEYQNLIRDIEQQKIHAVVVKKLDRLSRSLLDFEQLMITMQHHNVEFISLRENFDTTTAMGKAMLRMALVFAQLEREQTSERVADVMQFRASQGLRNGGTTPYGYRIVEKQLVPYAKEKEIVELIFKQFIETQSTVCVARFLNDIGSKNRSNKPWDCRGILWLLQNPVYKGDIRWKNQLFSGTHPPIISAQTFEQTQYFLKKKHKHTKTDAILQKLLVCGHCSVAMTPHYVLNRCKLKYYYYLCTNGTHHKAGSPSKCPHKRIALHLIQDVILGHIASLADELNFRPIANRIDKHNNHILAEEHRHNERLQTLRTDIAQLKIKKDRYFESLMTQSLLSNERKIGNDRLIELDIDERALKAQLHKQEFEKTTLLESKLDATDFRRTLTTFATHYQDWDVKTQALTLQRLIKDIRYHNTHAVLQFKAIPWTVQIPLKQQQAPP